jgi:NADPH:quinone reductase-like Zn-dependent oxidoreductase
VLATSFTRGELTWGEVLAPARFKPHGGAIPGHDLVGVIEEIQPPGHPSAELKQGDVVWGLVDFDRDGAAAEYVIALEGEVCLAPKCPEGVAQSGWYEQLATIPLSALTAWQALFVHGNLPKEREENDGKTGVVILGSGAVARAAIELARHAGIFVKAVTSSRSAAVLAADYVPSHLSNGQIIEDGTQILENLTAIDTVSGQPGLLSVDLIFDTSGGDLVSKLLTASQLSTVLKPGGKVISVAAPLSAFGAEIERSINQNCDAAKVKFHFFVVRPAKKEFEIISRIVQDGDLKGYVDSVWPLEKGREAMERVEARGSVKRGKVVLFNGPQ